MGSLTPGASYIYEHENGITYARKNGEKARQIIGYKHDSFTENIAINYELEILWKEILKESLTNNTLHEALERVKILYHLSKNNGEK